MGKRGSPTSLPKIYQAEAPTNANGAVYYFGSELTVEEAVAHRRSGGNVVVRGNDKKENLRKAQEIEDAVGPWQRDPPHKNSAGNAALPHFHQKPDAAGNRVPPGHTFYEVDKSKAKKKP
jgi:hypothetical protein